MTILWLIISVAAHFFTAFILMYCHDDALLWKEGKEIKLHKPSILDLETLEDKYMADKYVKEIIQPSHHYFILKREIDICQENDGCTNELVGGVLQVFSFLFIMRNVSKVFPNEYLHKTLYTIIIGVVCLVVCCLGCYIIRQLYNKHLALGGFMYTREDLENIFVYDETEFNISGEDAFNNYVILRHYNYLLNIEDSVKFRAAIKKVVNGLSAIIYFLFFMQVPE